MFVADRQWVDYVIFNPNFKKSTIITRVLRDEAKIKKIVEGIESGKKQIAGILQMTEAR